MSDLPIIQEYLLVDVNGFLVVSPEEVDCCQTQLVLYHILQALVVAHQTLLITELKIIQNFFGKMCIKLTNIKALQSKLCIITSTHESLLISISKKSIAAIYYAYFVGEVELQPVNERAGRSLGTHGV